MKLPTACPKPRPRKPTPKQQILRSAPPARESEKAKARRLARTPSSTPSRTPSSYSSIPRARKRTAAEERARHERQYGPPGFTAFVESLPCCACGVVGYSECAHVGNQGAGTGRKANADQIAPLCGPNYQMRFGVRVLWHGCHMRSHRGQRTFEQEMNVNLVDCAAETQRAFRAHVEGTR